MSSASVHLRNAFPLLLALAVAAWGVPAFEGITHGSISAPSLAVALGLTLLAGGWPLLYGKRLQGGHVERALACAVCNTLVWPAEQAFGFCLRCGTTKPAVATRT